MYISDNSHNNSIFPKLIFSISGVCLGFLITIIFMGGYRVTDTDMSPAFSPGDYIFINRFKTPTPGDVVLIRSPLQDNRFYLLRVIAISGSTVTIQDKTVIVNGVPFKNAKYSHKDNRIFPEDFTTRDNLKEMAIPEEMLFLIGDNWENCYDSRYFGPISYDLIKGVVFLKM